VGDLAHHRRAVRVDGIRERLQVCDDPVIPQVQIAERGWRVAGDHRRAADHGEPDPALRFFLMVQPVAQPGSAVLRIGRLVTRAHDPVAEPQVLELERLEQGLVAHRRLRG
jgi:hypothetical protein